MRAVVLREGRTRGPPDVGVDRTRPEEVLVDVVSTAVNRADLLQRMGLARTSDGPRDPGLEFAGRVAAVGERVFEHSVGDLVMGINNGGCYAEKLAIRERLAMKVPAALAITDAGAFPEVFITAGRWCARAA